MGRLDTTVKKKPEWIKTAFWGQRRANGDDRCRAVVSSQEWGFVVETLRDREELQQCLSFALSVWPSFPFYISPREARRQLRIIPCLPSSLHGAVCSVLFTYSHPSIPLFLFFSVWKPSFEAVRCPLTWSGQSSEYLRLSPPCAPH